MNDHEILVGQLICTSELTIQVPFLDTVATHLRAAIGLRAAFRNFLIHQNLSLCTVTFGEKVLTLAKSRSSKVRGYCICFEGNP